MDYPPKEPPPPYGMNVPPQHVQQPAVVQVVVPQQFGPSPQPLTCPSCQTPVNTRVEIESSMKTHLAALLLCIVCCPCFWLPYCCDTCQSSNHYCPKCNAFLGTYSS